MFSSKSDLWSTPQYLFDELNKEFNFDIDVCANSENAKCKKYYSEEQNGLLQEWTGVCWCNPPYGRQIGKWVEKAYITAKIGGGYNSNAFTGSNRYKMVSQLYISYCGNQIYKRAFKIWQFKKRGSFSFHDSNF
jgi:hypothetical protein